MPSPYVLYAAAVIPFCTCQCSSRAFPLNLEVLALLKSLSHYDYKKMFFFFEFLTLKVSLSVLKRTPDSRRSIYAQYGCTRGPRVLGT